MEWDEPVVEDEQDDGLAGPLGRYAGGTLYLDLRDEAYELRYEDDLVALLTRPGRYMVAATSAGAWELRHSRRSIFKIQAVDTDSGAVAARYRRGLFTGRRSIRTTSSSTYSVRSTSVRLQVSEGENRELFTVGPGRSGTFIGPGNIRLGELAVKIAQEPAVPSDLDVLVVLSCYLALLGETWVDPDPGGAMY
jgi:hypothetical protein